MIIKQNVFTDRIKLMEIVLDASPEVVFRGKYFNLERGKFMPYQMICLTDVFMDIVVALEAEHPALFNLITDVLPGLTPEPFVIGAEYLSASGLVLDQAIFALGPLEFFSEDRNKWVYRFSDSRPEPVVYLRIDNEIPSIPSKLDLTEPAAIIWDYVPYKPTFDPRQQWVREIGDNPKYLPFANLVYHLQLKYRFYLHLRNHGNTHKVSKMIAGIRELRVFRLAKVIGEISEGE